VVELTEPITEREEEVLALMAQGFSNLVIADQLTVNTGTVKIHVKNILRKLYVSSRIQAIMKGANWDYCRMSYES
jgi:DNA-binding NarL/FixJ family response regulator